MNSSTRFKFISQVDYLTKWKSHTCAFDLSSQITQMMEIPQSIYKYL